MVLFFLMVKADFDGIGKLSLIPNSLLCLDVRNPLSDFEVRERIVLDPTQYIEPHECEDNTREPPCHFALRWEGNKKRAVMEILSLDEVKTALKKKKRASSEIPRDLLEEDSGNFVPILALECRGVEPYAFHPRGGEFSVMSVGGTQFDGKNVDLSDGDWTDFDEEYNVPVTVSNFESKFVVA